MKINVKVKTNSSKEEILDLGNNKYQVYLKETPENNKANLKLIKLFSKFFGTSPKNINITFGKTSHEKILEIL